MPHFRNARTAFFASALLSLPSSLPSLAAGSARTGNHRNDSRIGSLIETLGKTNTPTQPPSRPTARRSPGPSTARGGIHQIHLHAMWRIPTRRPDKIVGHGIAARPIAAARSRKWSPDGKQLAFVSDCTAECGASTEQDQIFVWSKKTGESKQLTPSDGRDRLARMVARREVDRLPVCRKCHPQAGALAP